MLPAPRLARTPRFVVRSLLPLAASGKPELYADAGGTEPPV